MHERLAGPQGLTHCSAQPLLSLTCTLELSPSHASRPRALSSEFSRNSSTSLQNSSTVETAGPEWVTDLSLFREGGVLGSPGSAPSQF